MLLAGKISQKPESIAPAAWGSGTTWNSGDKSAGVTISGGGQLTASGSGGVRATTSHTTGAWVFELNIVAVGGGVAIGLSTASHNLSSAPGDDLVSVGYRGYSGQITVNGETLATPGTFTTGDKIGIVIDIDVSRFKCYKNGTLVGNVTYTSFAAALFPTLLFGSGANVVANFGATAFAYPYS